MPKLRRLTIVSLDPERLARYYEQVFDMRRVAEPKGRGVYLSDGYFNLTLIPNRAEGKPSGLNHIGFDVDPNEAEELLGDSSIGDCRARLACRQAGLCRLRGTDSDGNNMDISTYGFPTE